jgi:hypothetical protein
MRTKFKCLRIESSGGLLYSSTLSWPRYWIEVNRQFHAPSDLPPGKDHLILVGLGGLADRRAGLDTVAMRKACRWMSYVPIVLITDVSVRTLLHAVFRVKPLPTLKSSPFYLHFVYILSAFCLILNLVPYLFYFFFFHFRDGVQKNACYK